MAYLLGIDIGTSGTKSLICDAKGKVLATASAEHDIHSPQPGWSEQSPAQWWQATIKSVKAVVKKAKVARQTCKGIGLSGQMHGSVFLDDSPHETADALRPALLWNDQRTTAECDLIQKRAGGRKKLIDMVANPALTGFTAPKILWLQNNEPEIYEKTKHILLPKDFIRYKLTAEYATDVGDASGTLLLNVKTRKWHNQLISKLGIDKKLLPDCFESHVISGKLTKHAAKQLGLKPNIPVVGGSGDQPAGAVGNGIVSAGIVSATLGTSGVVFAHADKPTYDPRGRVHTMCHAVEGKWCVFGCMLSAGGSLQWFRNHLAQDLVASAKRKKVDPYELITAQAQRANPGSDGLLFLPYLTGERCPHPDPYARGGWIGLSASHSRPNIIRSIMEGVTFGMNDALQIMNKMDIPISSVRLSGGGAASPFWRQMQADIYQTPTTIINSGQGPAYGVAILAGVGTGVWKSVPEACSAIISELHRYEPQSVPAYKRAYRQYKKLYTTLKDTFPQLGKI